MQAALHSGSSPRLGTPQGPCEPHWLAAASWAAADGEVGIGGRRLTMQPPHIHTMQPRPKKLLDRVREAIRLKHYSIRTEEAYVS
jgi:hypothetical protein